MASTELLEAEYSLQRIVDTHTEAPDFVVPGSPNILCTPLPSHWRSNKALVATFKVFCVSPVSDGTRVVLSAGNSENLCAEMRGCQSEMRNQVAVFQDLRFLGKSGRGKRFNISIMVDTRPAQICIYSNAIKVTVDGPREPRSKLNGTSKSQRSEEESDSGGAVTGTNTAAVGAGGGRPMYGFPSYTSPAVDRALLRCVLRQARRSRSRHLCRLYCDSAMTEEQTDQLVRKMLLRSRHTIVEGSSHHRRLQPHEDPNLRLRQPLLSQPPSSTRSFQLLVARPLQDPPDPPSA